MNRLVGATRDSTTGTAAAQAHGTTARARRQRHLPPPSTPIMHSQQPGIRTSTHINGRRGWPDWAAQRWLRLRPSAQWLPERAANLRTHRCPGSRPKEPVTATSAQASTGSSRRHCTTDSPCTRTPCTPSTPPWCALFCAHLCTLLCDLALRSGALTPNPSFCNLARSWLVTAARQVGVPIAGARAWGVS